jgi:hypothetical protein
MKLVLSHPTGNANVRAAACGLNQAGMLCEFITSIASFPESMLDRLGAIGPLSEIRRRRFDQSLRLVTQTWPWIEAGRLIASKAGFTRLTRHETGPLCIDAVYKNIDRHVASGLKRSVTRGAKAVYAYEDGAQFTFG